MNLEPTPTNDTMRNLAGHWARLLRQHLKGPQNAIQMPLPNFFGRDALVLAYFEGDKQAYPKYAMLQTSDDPLFPSDVKSIRCRAEEVIKQMMEADPIREWKEQQMFLCRVMGFSEDEVFALAEDS